MVGGMLSSSLLPAVCFETACTTAKSYAVRPRLSLTFRI